MKKKIIGWSAFAAALLLIGFSVFRSDPKGSGPAAEVLDNPVMGSAPAAPALAPLAKPQIDASVVADGLAVQDERQSLQANGDVEHRRLVRRAGKYPNRIVVETLRKDRQLNKFVSVGRVEMVADHVLVNLREGASIEALEELAGRCNATVMRPVADSRTFLIQLEAPSLDAIEEAIAHFSTAAESIAYAEPDYVRHVSKVPNDTLYGNLWGLPKISAPHAWDITTGSKDVIVAIIDTGMDMDHPDLLANLWTNSAEIPGDGIDNDGNGYIDDVNGWDFVDEDKNPDDGDGHGTHVAGTIGAVGNNANQMVGVCWNVGLMPLRAGTNQGLLDSDIVAGIRYAARNGAKVLSNSYGGTGFSQTMYDAISYANDRGCIFVAAAGNDASNNDVLPQYPASYNLPNVISVAATDENDNLASFSNYGATSVDLAAPGVDIVSTWLNGETESLQGTSMACPHVAGAMGLLVSLDANVTPSEAKQLLLSSVDPIASLSDKVVAGGRMNVFAIFASANDADKDGMPDSWEALHGLDPDDPSDADLDNDGDFLTNLEEYKAGTDPHNPDTDGDSLIDGWEIKYGFNALDSHAALPKLQYLVANGSANDSYDVAVEGDYAYVADGVNGLRVFSIETPSAPQLLATLATSGSAHGVTLSGGKAYVSDTVTGLNIVDVSTPAIPALVGSVEMTAYNCAVQGGYAYVAAGPDMLQVVSVSNPAAPSIVGEFNNHYGIVNDVAVSGNYVYLAMDGYVGRLSIANPTAPSSYLGYGVYGESGTSNLGSIHVGGGHVYVSQNDYGFSVYNLDLSFVSRTASEGAASGIYEMDNLIFLADGSKGLIVFNGTDLQNITEYARYENISARNVVFADGHAYVAGGNSGLHVFRASADLDADGLDDKWEIQHFGNLSQGPFDDFDGDGLSNWGEYLIGTDPTQPDTDGDGLTDGDEVKLHLSDPCKPDTDGDGLTDYEEVMTHGTDPSLADTDGDGMPDKWEIDNGLDPLVDDADLDPDGDGATNREEFLAGTDLNNPDTDGDGIPDGWEIDMGLDPLVNDAALDSDGDGLTNLQEYGYNTNPLKADSDDDGLGDAEEINIHLTDPNNPDTDGDGMPDGWEIDHGLNPLLNDAAGDLDGDGLSNYEEYLNGSDPFNDDTDEDGFDDRWEYDWGTQATNAADPIVVDDDHPLDPQAYDPMISNPNEDGSLWRPFDSIQKAIDVAQDGMTVLVTNGYYIGYGNRNIDTKGKAITITAFSTNAIDTIIDADGLGAGFVFQSGETTNTVIRGFAITSPPGDCNEGDCGYENGIVCRDASSPTIVDCYVFDCALYGITATMASNPRIENTMVQACGGGILCTEGATPEIVDSSIVNCGSGIVAVDSLGLEISGSLITNCNARGITIENDPACSVSGSTIENNLGGMSFLNSTVLVDGCEIRDNIAPDYYTIGGTKFKSSVNIAVAAENNPDMTDIVDEDENGAGILLGHGSVLELRNSVLAGNVAVALDPDYPENKAVPDYGLGGGLYIGAECYATNMNCTYGDNEARRGGGISSHGTQPDVLRNTVLWGNDAVDMYIVTVTTLSTNLVLAGMDGTNELYNVEVSSSEVYSVTNITVSAFASLHCRSGAFDVWYSDVEHGGTYVKPYKYVISQDPLFDSNYALGAGSPCIDTGTITFAPIVDIMGTPRPLDGNNDGLARIDIGAYEYVHLLADTDGDGTLDADEIANGTDPTTVPTALLDFMAAYGLSSLDADDDGDGLSNLAEYSAGTNPTNSDTDGDRSPDGDELIAGTIATDPTSYFYVSDIRPRAEGGCEVVFDSVDGRVYTVYYCTEIGGAWSVLVADEPGDGTPMAIVDPNSEGSRFYKVEVAKLN